MLPATEGTFSFFFFRFFFFYSQLCNKKKKALKLLNVPNIQGIEW